MQKRYIDFYTCERPVTSKKNISNSPQQRLGDFGDPFYFFGFFNDILKEDLHFNGSLKTEISQLIFFEGISISRKRTRNDSKKNAKLWHYIEISNHLLEYSNMHIEWDNEVNRGDLQVIFKLLLNDQIQELTPFDRNQIMPWSIFPKILPIFYQRDSATNEMSSLIYYPEKLTINEQFYTIVSRLFSQTVMGTHYHAYLKLDTPIVGEYFYDDMKSGGYAQLKSGESNIIGYQKLTVMVFYIQDEDKV